MISRITSDTQKIQHKFPKLMLGANSGHVYLITNEHNGPHHVEGVILVLGFGGGYPEEGIPVPFVGMEVEVDLDNLSDFDGTVEIANFTLSRGDQ